jgi:hypothetical protein
MKLPSWQRWLKQVFRANSTPTRSKRENRRRPRLEALEDRIAPASSITIVAAGQGSLDATFAANKGTILVTDGRSNGTQDETLSAAALTSLPGTNDISITARGSIDFQNRSGTLSLPTEAGHSATFSTDVAGGGDITFDSQARTLSTAGGSINFRAGGNLTVSTLSSGGGAVSLTAGTQATSLLATNGILTSGGDVTLSADTMTLRGSINAGTGIVTLAPFTPSNTIAVGGPDAAGQLGIDDNDLSNVTAKVVRIGSTAQTGAITVDGTINTHAGFDTLDLIATGTGGAITQTTGSIAVANLALQAAAGIGTSAAPLKTALTSAATFGGGLAASAGTGGVFVSNDSAALNLTTVGTTSGVTATGGDVRITTTHDLTVSQPVSTATSGPNAGAVTLTGGTAAGSNFNVFAAISGSSASVLGGTGADVITVQTTGATPLTVDGQGGGDSIRVDLGALNAPVHVSETGSGSNTLTTNSAGLPARTGDTAGHRLTADTTGAGAPLSAASVSYGGIAKVQLDNATAVIAIAGPDTVDRGGSATDRKEGPAFTGANANLSANEQFVQVLYLDELGRAGSRAELDGWLPALAAGGPRAVAAAIATSFEAHDNLVRSWYISFLGRQANGTEEQGWVKRLASQSEEAVLSQVLSSSEFYSRAQTLNASGTADERYVQALYQLLLDRTPNTAEVASWVDVLPTRGRAGVALSFLHSREFRSDQFEGYYNTLLHRPDDPAGLAGWVASGLDLHAVRVGFEASGEFFRNG